MSIVERIPQRTKDFDPRTQDHGTRGTKRLRKIWFTAERHEDRLATTEHGKQDLMQGLEELAKYGTPKEQEMAANLLLTSNGYLEEVISEPSDYSTTSPEEPVLTWEDFDYDQEPSSYHPDHNVIPEEVGAMSARAIRGYYERAATLDHDPDDDHGDWVDDGVRITNRPPAGTTK